MTKLYAHDARNDEPVVCDICHKEVAANTATISGGYSVDPNDDESMIRDPYWCCDRCSNESEARYEASLFDVDRRESELAEMEY